MDGEMVKSNLGHFVSLITKEEVRIEGYLSYLNMEEEVFMLKNALCFGTEGRKKTRKSEIAPCCQIKDETSFRARDIKDLELIILPPHMLA